MLVWSGAVTYGRVPMKICEKICVRVSAIDVCVAGLARDAKYLGSSASRGPKPPLISMKPPKNFGETVEKAHVGMTRATNCTGCAGRDDEARARREERSAQHEGSEHALTTPTAFHPHLLYHDTR